MIAARWPGWLLLALLFAAGCDGLLDPMGMPAEVIDPIDPIDPPPYPQENPCEGQSCSGHGRCEANAEGWPVCVCDGGYLVDGLACAPEPATGRPFGPCDLAIPDHVTITRAIWSVSPTHFYVPNHLWALAAAHAALELTDLAEDGLDLRLPPSHFFALGLELSFLGCDDAVGADPLHPDSAWKRIGSTDRDGCFQFQTTTWDEQTQVYPQFGGITHGQVISAENQALLGRANFETSALAIPYLSTFNYALLTLNIADPDTWFKNATDPQALEKLMALAYNQGAWSSTLKTALKDCQKKPIEQCLTGDSAVSSFVKSVSGLSVILQQAVRANQCHGGDLDTATVQTYLDRIRPLFPTEDWAALSSQVQQAFVTASGGATSAPFQQVAKPVLETLHDQMKTRLRCPGQKLQEIYAKSCPP